VVEFDGWRWHGARGRFESDRVRENWLRNHEWRVVRVTYRELDEEPEQVLVWIATEIANARNALRRG
jgi:very-short-patch-repair endonuclease